MYESTVQLFFCFLCKVIYAPLCDITAYQQPLTLYHSVVNSITKCRKPLIKILSQWEKASTLAASLELCTSSFCISHCGV